MTNETHLDVSQRLDYPGLWLVLEFWPLFSILKGPRNVQKGAIRCTTAIFTPQLFLLHGLSTQGVKIAAVRL